MTPGVAAGSPAAPGPRAHVLARLEAERRQALGCFAHARAAELEQQIRDLSAGTAESPRQETTGHQRAARKAGVR